jgi:starch synthase (maltosyl-transferring)
MRIYNLFPLLAGPFGCFTEHLERAKSLGFDWVFLNPIQKPGRSGSLYSIADYFALNPRLLDATSPLSPEAQARQAIDTAHRLGLRVMVDLVINHCAIDSALTREHPEWFEREGGGIRHPFCIENGEKTVWTDLAKFDHEGALRGSGLTDYLFSVIEYLDELGCDGFRCDAAYQVPGRLWSELMQRSRRKRPECLFVAETLGCTADQTRETARAGFDFVFNSSKWWDFKAPWLLAQYDLTRELVPSIGFPESHDTERLLTECHGNLAEVKLRTLFSALFATGFMIPMGFEFGFQRKLHVVDTRPEHWESPTVDLSEFLERLNRLKAEYQVFREECPTEFLHIDNPMVAAMWKGSLASREEALVLMNTDVHGRQTVWFESLRRLVQSGAALSCVSPENPMEHVAEPFHYELRPGEAIVLVTRR